MEDLEILLTKNGDYLMSSSEDNATDDEDLSIGCLEGHVGNVPTTSFNCEINVNAKVSKKRNGEQRLPTRRPDPNVYNRNALLARENRRKKKIYLESIEKELQDARKANRTLLKALKRQSKVSRRLEQEKKYFQSLFTNRSEILNLFSAVNICRLPNNTVKSPFSGTSNFDYDKTTYSCNSDPYTSSPSSSSQDPLSINFDNPSDDFEGVNGSNLSPSTGWDDLWINNGYHNNAVDNLPIPMSSPQRKDIVRTVNVDHSYVAASIPDSIQTPRQQNDLFSESPRSQSSLDIDVGTENCVTGNCLHVAGDNVLIDFCPICHWNSNNRTPPLQLLNDESLP